jgi:hypothetical protein
MTPMTIGIALLIVYILVDGEYLRVFQNLLVSRDRRPNRSPQRRQSRRFLKKLVREVGFEPTNP